jgi:hypothetical protein
MMAAQRTCAWHSLLALTAVWLGTTQDPVTVCYLAEA